MRDLVVMSWNVNGLRARWPLVRQLLLDYDPDVLCLQETRCPPEEFPEAQLGKVGYTGLLNPGTGYSGVAIITRKDIEVSDPVYDLPGIIRRRSGGHWMQATVEGIRLSSIYAPTKRARSRLAARIPFLQAVALHARSIKEHPIVIAGDFNVIPEDKDVYEPKRFAKSPLTDADDRTNLGHIIREGVLVDAQRHFHPNEPGYTCWDFRGAHFGRNLGLRIDLFLVSAAIGHRIVGCEVDRTFRVAPNMQTGHGPKPSNHAPILLMLSGADDPSAAAGRDDGSAGRAPGIVSTVS